ncbi:tyrosine-type recombinase/integrase [Bacillus marasmi]|uniref:tyrosine-type recombinase/integrase n=1 Tax=Bacillus marasmi TaxID=1926279 RepID=UPI00164D8225|nr:site-specific integrase [Bacillus marasmi]
MAKKVIIETGKQERYAVIFDERKDPRTGRLHIKQMMFNSSEEADVFLEELGSVKEDVRNQMTLDQKVEEENTQIPFNQFAKEWFYGEQSQLVTEQTFKVRQALLDKHIAPYFGDMYLYEITEKDVIGLFTEKMSEGYSEGLINGIKNFLATLFRSAVKKGFLNKNPMSSIKKIKVPNRNPIILSDSEIIRLLEKAKEGGEGKMYEFTLSTGLRLAELLALTWRDIDFDQKTINVKNIVLFGGDGNHNIIKMNSGYRRVNMPESLLPMLQEHKNEQKLRKEDLGDGYHNELDLVFPNKDGGIQKPSTVCARFNRLVDKANIRRISFHDLRKTYAALLIKSGVSPDLVMYQLGYKNIEAAINFLGPQFLDPKILIHAFGNDEKNND